MEWERRWNSRKPAFINKLVWENGYAQLVGSPTRVDALLDVYLVRPENSVVSYSIVQGISDHYGLLLEVEWGEIWRAPQVETLVPVYYKTDVLGLQLRDKLAKWAGNGSWVEEIRKNFKEIVFQSIELSLPHEILKKNPNREY
jgi:hypothetical protein